jgi:molybdopterin-guanine dinucleotide biosynthesis protein A
VAGATAVRTSRPVFASARTTVLAFVAGVTDGTDSATKGMAINSIKQKPGNTFHVFASCNPWTMNLDANILDILTSSNSNRAAWVLVGGRSSRMGSDKARADSGGRALALRVADKAASVCATVSLVGDPAIYNDWGLPVIADRLPGLGPLAGIEAALAASESDNNLIIACDMPALDENLLEALFAAGGDCALPRHDDGKIEPLCAVYQRGCGPVIREALESGVRKVTDALRSLEDHGLAIRYIRVSNPSSFANLNTPEDWRRYHYG